MANLVSEFNQLECSRYEHGNTDNDTTSTLATYSCKHKEVLDFGGIHIFGYSNPCFFIEETSNYIAPETKQHEKNSNTNSFFFYFPTWLKL